jgi:hypothetical protein
MQPPRVTAEYKITQLKAGVYHAWLSLTLPEPPSQEFLDWCGELESVKEVSQHNPTNCTLILERSDSYAGQRSKIGVIVRSMNEAFHFGLYARELGHQRSARLRIARSGILPPVRLPEISLRRPGGSRLSVTIKNIFSQKPKDTQ